LHVFDLDPAEPAQILDCGRVALHLKDLFDTLNLQSFVKVSGSKGLLLFVPLNCDVTYEMTQPFAKALAELAGVDLQVRGSQYFRNGTAPGHYSGEKVQDPKNRGRSAGHHDCAQHRGWSCFGHQASCGLGFRARKAGMAAARGDSAEADLVLNRIYNSNGNLIVAGFV
jgi:hypothetical protein